MPLTAREKRAYALVKYARAKEALSDAENSSSSRRNRINRAYYSQFNCELSLLSAIGIDAGSSHSGTRLTILTSSHRRPT